MFNDLFPILPFIIGLIVGSATFWFVSKANDRRLKAEMDQLKMQYEEAERVRQHLQIEMASSKERLAYLIDIDAQKNIAEKEAQNARQLLAAANQEIVSLRQQIDALSDEKSNYQQNLDDLQKRLSDREARLAQLTTARAAEQSAFTEKIDLLMQARNELSKQFQDVATNVLEGRTKELHEQQKLKLDNALGPLKETLNQFQQKIDKSNDDNLRGRTELSQLVKLLTDANMRMTKETENLTRALKSNVKTQGNWGEMVLENLLEISGLTKGREYDTQVSGQVLDHEGNGKKVIPDVILHIPGDRHLVIDAKVSLLTFDRYINAENENEKRQASKDYLMSVRKHMTELSGKNYQSMHGLKTVDYVIMFVPMESAFLTAISEDTTLYQEAWQKNVLLVCPSTLLFALRMVDALWRQENQRDNAKKVLEDAEQLYKKFVTFYSHFEKMGKYISQTQEVYEDASKSLKTGKGNLYFQIDRLANHKLISPKTRLPDLHQEDEGETPSRIDGHSQEEEPH